MREYIFGAVFSLAMHVLAVSLIPSAEIEPPHSMAGQEAFTVELVEEEMEKEATINPAIREIAPKSPVVVGPRGPLRSPHPAQPSISRSKVRAEDTLDRSHPASSGDIRSDERSGSSSGASMTARPDQPRNPLPRYPTSARRAGQEGVVEILVWVSASGDPEDVKVHRSSGFAALDSAAVSAVRRWRFLPARRRGSPVASSLVVPVRFRLDR